MNLIRVTLLWLVVFSIGCEQPGERIDFSSGTVPLKDFSDKTIVDGQILNGLLYGRMASGGMGIAKLSESGGASWLGYWKGNSDLEDMEIQGDFAYLTLKGSPKMLATVDISDPSAPTAVNLSFAAFYDEMAITHQQRAYSIKPFRVFDVSGPVPKELGRFKEGPLVGSLGYLKKIVSMGDYAIGTIIADNVLVIDCSDPGNPRIASHIPAGDVDDIQVDDQILICEDDKESIQAFDLSDPTKPVTISGLPSTDFSQLRLIGDVLIANSLEYHGERFGRFLDFHDSDDVEFDALFRLVDRRRFKFAGEFSLVNEHLIASKDGIYYTISQGRLNIRNANEVEYVEVRQ